MKRFWNSQLGVAVFVLLTVMLMGLISGGFIFLAVSVR